VKGPGSSRISLWGKGGQATLEFVLLIPLIIMVILVVSQSGQMVYRKNILQQAAREGVRVNVYGSKNNMIPGIEIQPGNESERKIGDMVTISLIDTGDYGVLWSIISAATGKKILLKAGSSMRMESQ